jgi:FAD:protein FMN transferase
MRPDNHSDHSIPFVAMASDCEVRLAGVSGARARTLATLAMTEVRRIESKYSRYRADSVVSQINAAAGNGEPIAIDAETAQLLAFATQLFELSDGLFDATSGVLRQVWDFKTGRKPTALQLAEVLPRIGWNHLQWSDQSARLTLPGMELDFGGFGKEYAADRAATLLANEGIQHGLVNLGGDIRVIGPQADGSPWLMGIRHPREARQDDAVIASIPISNGALATSGDYERFFVEDGERYCHILNPKTGWPAQHWQSISVIAPLCVAAGAMSTTAMLKGHDALAFLDGQGVSYLAIDVAGVITRSD